MDLSRDVPLAGLTTLGVGGPAWAAGEAPDPATLRALLDHADAAGRPALVLGGGSNVLVSDGGFPGLVIRPTDRRLVLREDGDHARLEVGAGVPWDALVARAVDEGLQGLEALSGIPGLAGAAPVQNVGAYGQEVGDVLVAVEVLDRTTGAVEWLPADACGFGYRDSHFKGRWRDTRVVTGLELRLSRVAPPRLAYAELARALPALPADRGEALREVRRAVLRIRAAKAMVLDPADPDTRSAGSFFVNPVVDAARADAVAGAVARLGHDPGSMPRFAAGPGRVKLSAAYLIERAGFRRGHALGPAALSSKHVLALVNRGGARAADLVALAIEVREGVLARFGVRLAPEPVRVGFDEDPLA